MKMKIIGIIVSMMLITTLFAVAQPPKTQTNETQTPTSTPTSIDAPIWTVGDQWVYKVDNITINFNQTGNDFFMYLQMDELPLTVTEVRETSYLLDFETSVNGNSILDANLGDGPINATVNLPNLQISGSVEVDKSTLGIKAITADLNGRFWIDIKNQPYLDFQFPVLPFKVTSNLLSDFSLPVSMLSFPLNTTTMWNLTATNMTMNGEIHSPWFYIFHLINGFYPFLPEEIDALLPVVNIADAFTTLGTGNIFGIPMITGAFYCLNTEQITIPGGSYDAYNITILNGTARCFYAPNAGSIVKITGDLQQIIPYIKNINMELLSTTYN